jgi:hypothetical protein
MQLTTFIDEHGQLDQQYNLKVRHRRTPSFFLGLFSMSSTPLDCQHQQITPLGNLDQLPGQTTTTCKYYD